MPSFSIRKPALLAAAKTSEAIRAHRAAAASRNEELRKEWQARRVPVKREASSARFTMADLNAKAWQFLEARAGLPISKLTDYASFLETGTGKVWATYRCVSLVSDVCAGAKLSVVNKKTGVELPEDSQGLPLLLAQPNPYDSIEDIVRMTVAHLKLTGNAYWLMDELRGGKPTFLYLLMPQNMKIVPDAKTRINRFIYSVNGVEVQIPVENVIHFRKTHPTSFIHGLGDVEGGAAIYEENINTAALKEKFLSNGAQPSGLMSKKDIYPEPEEWEAMKDKWLAQYGGSANAGKVAFMTGDWSFTRMGLTMQEMESIAAAKWNIEQICLNHGVPLSVIGLQGAANFATARVDDIRFRRYTCLPLLQLVAGQLNKNMGLAMSFDQNTKAKFALEGLEDVGQIVKDLLPLVVSGVITPNEMREKCGIIKSPDPQMDQVMINNNRVPLDMAGAVDGGANEPALAPAE